MNKPMASPAVERGPHQITIRIYYEDTDFLGLFTTLRI